MSNDTTTDLSSSLRQVRDATVQLAASLKATREAGRGALRRASYCVDGMCYGPRDRAPAISSSGGFSAAGSGSEYGASAGGLGARDGAATIPLGSIVGAAMRAAISGDLKSALQTTLQSTLKSLATSIAGSVAKGAGGGIGGGLLGSVVGGSLGLLIGSLFKKRESVKVDNVVRAEVLNFPRLSSLDFASNPASRLFGGRAVARGPAFSVEVSYRGGAEDVVTAKVAQKLMDINTLHGMQ